VVNLSKYKCKVCGMVFTLTEFEERRAEKETLFINNHIVFRRGNNVKAICPKG